MENEDSEDSGEQRWRCWHRRMGREAQEGQEVDGLTTNGVLIMHPKAVFCPGPDYRGEVAKPGIWREVSVGGKVFGLRESRSAATQVRFKCMAE